MAEKPEKPSLAVIIAASKKRQGAAGGEGGPSDDAGAKVSPECVSCVRNFFEAGADGDFEGAARALQSAMQHADMDAGEPDGDEGPADEE